MVPAIYALAAGAAGGIWIGTHGGLHHLDQKSDEPNGDITGGQGCRYGAIVAPEAENEIQHVVPDSSMAVLAAVAILRQTGV